MTNLRGEEAAVDIALRHYLTGFMIVCLANMFMPHAYGQAEKGQALFVEYCVECHGIKGDGRGAVGLYLEGQRPANLLTQTTQARSDQELFEIIKFGVHLEMPTWEDIFDDQEIRHVVTYLRQLASSPTATHE